jgi:hypothetical protein
MAAVSRDGQDFDAIRQLTHGINAVVSQNYCD